MASELYTLDIPYRNHIGIILRGDQRKYVVISQCLKDEDLLIYHVVNIDVDGEHYEAQMFLKCRLPLKLYLSRKRRIQRLKRSDNLREEFELSDAIVLVSRIPEEGLGRHQNCQLTKEAKTWYKFSQEQYPPLPLPTGYHPNANPQYSPQDFDYPSYAEAASLPQRRIYTSCPVDYLSKTKEGIKQRERRREERFLKRNRHSWLGNIPREDLVSTGLWVPQQYHSGRGRSCSPFITRVSSVENHH
ncbi:hypothetical protein F4805DRAFT_437028 [Annulohypoxylon moriforme]|nr:hypothetical protein F4805DRAFT_437028 [Annulohypoxylon moriforme]